MECRKWSGWVITGVEEGRIGLHVFVDVFRAYVVAQAVCVGEQEVGMVVLGADVLVVKIVHQRLAEVEDAHAHVDRFVELQVGYLQLHACQVFIEDLESPELGLGHLSLHLPAGRAELYVGAFTHVLHCLPEHRIVSSACRSPSQTDSWLACASPC